MFKPRKVYGRSQRSGSQRFGSGRDSGPGAAGARGASKFREGADSRNRFVRKKVCRLCAERIAGLDYKDTDRLVKFLTEKGKILPQRISGNCAQHQRLLAKAVKRSRHATLISFQIGSF